MAIREIAFDLSLPGPDNLDPSKVPRYPAGADRGVPRRIDPWGEYTQAVLVQPVVMTMGKVVTSDTEVDLTATCRPAHVTIYPAEIRSPAMHVVVPHRKACHIASVDDDGDHRRPWHAVGMHRLVKVVHRDKVVVVGRDIVGQVDPGSIVIHLIVKGLRRQGSPSEIVVVLPPRHPRRSPIIPRDPHPSVPREKHPAAIVVDRPPERLVREPGPALVGIHPTTPGVGSPRRVNPQCRRLPDVSVIPCLEPLPETRKLCKENLMVPGI